MRGCVEGMGGGEGMGIGISLKKKKIFVTNTTVVPPQNPVLTCNIGLSIKRQKIKSCAKMQWLGKYLQIYKE